MHVCFRFVVKQSLAFMRTCLEHKLICNSKCMWYMLYTIRACASKCIALLIALRATEGRGLTSS